MNPVDNLPNSINGSGHQNNEIVLPTCVYDRVINFEL
jgi:hypothetical protein